MTDGGSGLILSPIKVIINMPTVTPVQTTTTAAAGAFEDTMFLIDLMRQQREKEVRAKKEQKILEMARKQKETKAALERQSMRAATWQP